MPSSTQAEALRAELSEVRAELREVSQNLEEAEEELEEAQVQLRKAEAAHEEQQQGYLPRPIACSACTSPAMLSTSHHRVIACQPAGTVLCGSMSAGDGGCGSSSRHFALATASMSEGVMSKPQVSFSPSPPKPKVCSIPFGRCHACVESPVQSLRSVSKPGVAANTVSLVALNVLWQCPAAVKR